MVIKWEWCWIQAGDLLFLRQLDALERARMSVLCRPDFEIQLDSLPPVTLEKCFKHCKPGKGHINYPCCIIVLTKY